MLYPLKFKPVFKEKIWGGQKILTSLGLDFAPLPNCGEAWALSGVSGFETIVTNGFLEGNELNEILEIYMDDLVGEKVFQQHPKEFPILIKFIDANDYLSIQVHPDDMLAARRDIGSGKSEMWYILDADPGAELITGFNRKMNEATYLEFLNQKRLKEALNVEKVKKGDVFFIPSGRVHALGPGILLAEIQQTSDTTYRIYDWDRVDSEGKSRELHTDLALEAIDFSPVDTYRTNYKSLPNKPTTLVECVYFTTNLLEPDREIRKDYSALDSFVIYICVEGKAEIRADENSLTLTQGEVILLPAIIPEVIILPEPDIKILEIYIP
ncbi:MAG: mannose-6-phosphate isomerase [Bacteroidales bacterium]|nr:mannose-6-phosphate isomerase [Bacteroidales bacterium]